MIGSKPLAALDLAAGVHVVVRDHWLDQVAAEPLVMPFLIVMREHLGDDVPKVLLAEEDVLFRQWASVSPMISIAFRTEVQLRRVCRGDDEGGGDSPKLWAIDEIESPEARDDVRDDGRFAAAQLPEKVTAKLGRETDELDRPKASGTVSAQAS